MSHFENLVYMELRARYLALADQLCPNYSPAQKDAWAHQNAELRATGRHMLSGGVWSRKPEVLK